MKRFSFGAAESEPITQFNTRGAHRVHLASGRGEGHANVVHFEERSRIDLHPAGFDQLFLVVQGSGWVEDAGGRRLELQTGEGAHIETGEQHAKGSDTGMVAVMVQLTEMSEMGASIAGRPG